MINKGPDGQPLHFEQNLILIAAPFAAGKTHTIKQIHSFFGDHDLWYGKPITDSVYIEKALEADHRFNEGVNHMHDNQTHPEKHEHYPGEPDLHFSVTGSYIPRFMHKHFFEDLSRGFWDNYLYPVEWSGGGNTNPRTHPASNADYSFASQVEGMRSGIYESSWLSKVLLVIHPLVPDGSVRDGFNARRKEKRDPTQTEIEYGMGSWWIPESGMHITGRNDFPDVIPTLENMGLGGRIHVIPNDGGEMYNRELRRILEERLGPMLEKEGHPVYPEGDLSSSRRRDRR